MTARDIFARREDQRAWGLRFSKFGGGVQSAAPGTVSGGAKYAIRGPMVSGDVVGVTLRSEVIDHQQSVLGVERERLERITRRRPRPRQVEPIHASAKMLLVEGRQLTLEGAGLACQVKREVGITEHSPVRRRQQRKADQRRCKFSQLQTGSYRGDKRIGLRCRAQLNPAHRPREPHFNVRHVSRAADRATGMEEEPYATYVAPTGVSINASLFCGE